MTRRIFDWARVEYQPDLKKPVEPITLGVIVVAHFPNRQIAGAVILGREPNISNLPDELGEVGTLGLAQLVGWGPALAQDATVAFRENKDVFAFLSSRRQSNLFVRDPEKYETSAKRVSLLNIAERLYLKCVGKPFRDTPVVRTSASLWRKPRHDPVWFPSEAANTVPLQASEHAAALT